MDDKKIESLNDNNIVLRDIVEHYVRNWKWFAIGAILALLTTFLVLRFIPALYQVNLSIKVKDDSSGAISELSAFEDMGMFMNQKSNVDNEIEVIESRNLLASVVKDLKLNVKYHLKGKTFLEDVTSLFTTNPIPKEIYHGNPININFFESDSIVLLKRTRFEISLLSSEKFHFKEGEKEKQLNNSFGNTIKTTAGDIIITPNVEVYEKYLNKTIVVTITPLQSVVNYLKTEIEITSIKKTDIVTLGIKIEVKEKGIDILNNLIHQYNADAVNEKSLISANTSDFISNRLQVVSDELSQVDLSIEDYRTKNNIIDIESQAGINLQSDTENQVKIIDANNQLNMIIAVEEYINNQTEVGILPESLGFSDASLSASISKYNELVLTRNEMLKNVSDIHPAVVNLNEQLVRLKSTIKQGLINLKNSIQITINGLQQQDAVLNSKLFAAPKKQRELIDITRQQAVKEELYLYLLQKREEIAISLGIAAVNAKIIDSAYSSGFPVFPNKTLSMIAALFAGLLIPFLILYAGDIIDTKVHNRADIERELRVPMLGEIPFTGKKKKRVLSKDDRSATAEAFRLVRTNLDFMLTNNNEKSKVIMVTSTIGNEGKTFVALNLAKTLAASDKKVLLLGLDLRAPTITKTLKLEKVIGVTHYITDANVSINDITNKLPETDNLDLIISGIIPPNPAELLMSARLENLFDEVKEKYDYIVVDTSPLSLVTDTLILNKFASLFVYIVRAEFLDRRMLNVPKAIISEGKLNNMAILINGIKQNHNNYGYGYGYGIEGKKPWYKKMFS